MSVGRISGFLFLLVVSCVALATAFGCASRPDIVGHNSEAREWAQEQKDEPADQTKNWPGARPRPDGRSEAPQTAPAQPDSAPAGDAGQAQ